MSADNSVVRPREVLFEDLSVDAKGPLVFASTREVDDCTDPQHTDFSEHLGRSVSMSGTQRAAARQAADATLLRLFPRTEGREVFVWVEAPRLGGHLAANTTTKFTCPLSATSEVQGLFLTGRDLSTCGLAGDLQSGWAAANAILGEAFPLCSVTVLYAHNSTFQATRRRSCWSKSAIWCRIWQMRGDEEIVSM
jgi:hypothetical protein